MTTRKKVKRVPPARIRYETANPTVSVRISQELKEELDELKITSGLSIADILKAGLDRLKLDVEEIYERGYVDGYEIAEVSRYWPRALVVERLICVGQGMMAVAARKLIGWSAKSCR